MDYRWKASIGDSGELVPSLGKMQAGKKACLTNVPYLEAAARTEVFKKSFLEAAGNTKTEAIRVDLAGYEPNYNRPGDFQWELDTIAGNTTLRMKTYYVNNATR